MSSPERASDDARPGPTSRFRDSMMRPTLLLAALVLALSAPASASGATRYVSPAGTSNATCGQNAPCDVVTAIAGLGVADGDVVLIAPGSYGDVGGLGDIIDSARLTIRGTGTHPADTRLSVGEL